MAPFCRRLWYRLKLWCFSLCLPLLSLTQTPSGGNVEWMAACCDPFFDYCERAVWIVGVVCFILVIIGISLVVFTFYVYMMPFVYHTENGLVFTFYFILGNYLLINIVFHYFSGVYTNPGQTIKGSDVKLTDEQIKLGWKVCYKCDASKPPRAHHCRICGRCVYKMDHHCRIVKTWMFNCIGHYNHRHFMLFIIFMWCGVCYVVHCAWTRVVAGMNLNKSSSLERANKYPLDHSTNESFLVIVVFFICFGVVVALTALGGWNMYLVSRGETAIEFYMNKSEAIDFKRMGKRFVNPYNHGIKKNWRLFLGLSHNRSLIRHVLLPSGHTPVEDGRDWLRSDITRTENSYNNV